VSAPIAGGGCQMTLHAGCGKPPGATSVNHKGSCYPSVRRRRSSLSTSGRPARFGSPKWGWAPLAARRNKRRARRGVHGLLVAGAKRAAAANMPAASILAGTSNQPAERRGREISGLPREVVAPRYRPLPGCTTAPGAECRKRESEPAVNAWRPIPARSGAQESRSPFGA
jgi:hypothetical protein